MPALVTSDPVPWGWTHPSERRPCEWGTCGHCDAGRHERCQFLRWPARGRRSAPHTWVLDRRGQVISPHFPVFIPGADRDWVCSCHRQGHPTESGQVALW
jgi:hypothetical protein